MLIRVLPLLTLLTPLAGCASTLPDAMAETTEATRPATVRAMEGMADVAQRLPATLDQVNALLARGLEASEDMRRAQAALEGGVGRVTSSTAAAIDGLGALVASLDRALVVTTDLLASAREETDRTRDVRLRVLESVAQVTSSTESLVAHLDAAAGTWATRAGEVRAEEERALRALADLAEASARTGEQVRAITATLGRTADAVEPDVRTAATSAARTLVHVETITGRLASTEVGAGTTEVAWALLGAAVTVVVLGASVAVRALFRRAVAREVVRLGAPAA